MEARIAQNILQLLSTATATGPQQAVVMVEATQALSQIVQAEKIKPEPEDPKPPKKEKD